MSWLNESNRMKHFVYAIPCAIIAGIRFIAGLAIGMEFKDYEYGNKFDWLDIAATMLGGIIGQIIRILILWIFLYLYLY